MHPNAVEELNDVSELTPMHVLFVAVVMDCPEYEPKDTLLNPVVLLLKANIPKAVLKLELRNPLAYHDPVHVNMCNMCMFIIRNLF